jgi:hypothetical protein
MRPSIFAYILSAIFRKIGRFFTHWYGSGSLIFWHSVLDFFSELERMMSLRITAANWYKPLYQDYSRAGVFIGIPIRLGRILVTTAIYLFLAAFFTVAYLIYLSVPIFLISRLA